MPNITLEIVFGGLLALVQPPDEQGILVIAPKHDSDPAHHMQVERVCGTLGGDLVGPFGGYELSILDSKHQEFKPGKIEIASTVEVEVPVRRGGVIKTRASLLDSWRIVPAFARESSLVPAGNEKLSKGVEFRARLRSGEVSLDATAHKGVSFRAMNFSLAKKIKITKERFISQVIYRKSGIAGEYIILEFKPLDGSVGGFETKIYPDQDGKISLAIKYETKLSDFCSGSTDDFRLQHSLAAFKLVGFVGLPRVEIEYNYEDDAYPRLADACDPRAHLDYLGGEPAICYVIRIPAKKEFW